MASQQRREAGPNGRYRVTAQELGAKMRSKREIYRFMTAEVHAYISSYETVTIFHLRDLASGKRKILKTEAVKYYEAPHYEGLSMEDMLEFSKQYAEVRQYLPVEQREVKKLPRIYLSTLLYSIIGVPFAKWVERRIEERNEKIADERELNTELDPDIYAALMKSSSISVQKGISHNLFKVGAKRRRSKNQIQEDRDLEKRQKEEIDEKMTQFQKMQSHYEVMSQQLKLAEGMHQEVQGLIANGILKQDRNGNVEAVLDLEEQSQLKELYNKCCQQKPGFIANAEDDQINSNTNRNQAQSEDEPVDPDKLMV